MKLFLSVGTTKFDELINNAATEEFTIGILQLGFESLLIQHGSSPLPLKWSHDCYMDTEKKAVVRKGDTLIKKIDCECYSYKPSLATDLKNCDVLICSGGAGTILEAMELGKIIVVVPNCTLQDNHQLEIVEELESSELIVSLKRPSGALNVQELLQTLDYALKSFSKRPQWGPPEVDLLPVFKNILKI
jgi:UDP-N-acetylglucosamine transferase subunit ALG13